MNRRDWMKTLGAACLVGARHGVPLHGAPLQGEDAPSATTSSTALETEIVRLQLRHTWTTTMSSSAYRDTLYVRFTRDGITGHGEGAPIVRYQENAAGARQAAESVRDLVTAADPWEFEKLHAEIAHCLSGQYAAQTALDIALMDWVGQKLGIPLYRYFGLDPNDAPITTFSIGIDTPAITRQKVREAESFPVLKIKVGLDTDEATIAAVRSVTRKPLRVDANEGWKNKEEAVRKINWLATQGVEFVEQPMPAQMLEETRWVHERVHLPLIADEACQHAGDVPKLVGIFDGVNVKLDKAGGILEAFEMIQIARALGLRTMLGCMVSSSVSVTAAAHLSPLVDYADLDGNLLIANDPFSGVSVKNGKLLLPHGPGLGLRPAEKIS
jgi:L-alanine-DL-glutamate epimerase-like enolase superfamily enzyme